MKQWMRWKQRSGTGVMTLTAMLVLALLTGCGSVVRSNVTAFHEWPAQLPDKRYVFERSQEQDASLEYRNYENLVRAELNRLGLMEAGPNAQPYLKVRFQTAVQVRDVREVYPVVTHPQWYSPAWRMHYHPYYGAFPPPFYHPFYDPMWYGPPLVQQREANYQVFTRQLRLRIAHFADDKPLYEATVVSEGENGLLATIMPYLVRSAFKDFPGPSGITRQVELKLDR